MVYGVSPLGACISSVPLHRFRHVHRNFLTPAAITDRLLPCYHWLAKSVDARQPGRNQRRCCCSKSELRFLYSFSGANKKKKNNTQQQNKKNIMCCISEQVSRIGPESLGGKAHSLLVRAAKQNRWCAGARLGGRCVLRRPGTLCLRTLRKTPPSPPFSVDVR